MTRVRPIAGLTKAVTVLLVGWIVVNVAALPVQWRFVATGRDRMTDWYAATIAALVLYVIATGIVFVVWLYRARSNAESLGPLRHRRSRGWLFWGWIVPMVSLWFGYQIVDDLRRASDPATRRLTNPPRNNSTLVNVWWGMFLIGLYTPSLTMADERTQSIVSMVLLPPAIVAAVLAIVLVRSIASMQETPDSQSDSQSDSA